MDDKIESLDRSNKDCQDNDEWQFVFLSADLASITDSHEYGFLNTSSMKIKKSKQGFEDMYSSLSDKIRKYRSSESDDVSFSDEDRKKQDDPPDHGIKIDE